MNWTDAPRWLRLLVWALRAKLDLPVEKPLRAPTWREAWRGTFEITEADKLKIKTRPQ